MGAGSNSKGANSREMERFLSSYGVEGRMNAFRVYDIFGEWIPKVLPAKPSPAEQDVKCHIP